MVSLIAHTIPASLMSAFLLLPLAPSQVLAAFKRGKDVNTVFLSKVCGVLCCLFCYILVHALAARDSWQVSGV